MQGIIQRFDAHRGEFSVFLHAWKGHYHVVGIRQSGIIDLQNETGVNDRFVFVFNRIRQSEQILFIRPVILVVEEVLQPAGRKDTHKCFFYFGIRLRQRRLEELEVLSNLLLPDVADWTVADGALRWRR